jgi:hypothetical protein
MRNHEAKLSELLLEAAQSDGSFPAARGNPGNPETTALAALALARGNPGEQEAARRAQDWLLDRQRPDGGWAIAEGIDEPSWASAPALLALLAAEPPEREPIRRATDWLVAREGQRPSLPERLIMAALNARSVVDQDPALRGWPWHANSGSWVEPTAFAMLALRRTPPQWRPALARERVAEGEALLLDRMCPGGGWNYGNKRVLGEELEPFPDVTAIALLALQGSPAREALDASLWVLQEALVGPHSSGLSLSLGATAMALHGQPSGPILERLRSRLAEDRPAQELRSAALALLALRDGQEAFRV